MRLSQVCTNAAIVMAVVAGCTGEGTGPGADATSIYSNPDSLAARNIREGRLGQTLAAPPGTTGTDSPPMELLAPGGFRVTLINRECAAPNVVMSVVSPVDSLLGSTMCQEPFPRTWRFDGPYPAGADVVLNVVPNFSTAQGAFRVHGSYPEWLVEVEAGLDLDFNDLVFVVSAEPAVDMVLEEDAGFEIELIQRDCTTAMNLVELTSPLETTLTNDICQEAVGNVWSFEDTITSGTPITLGFTSGVPGAQGQLRLYGNYPEWTITAEEGDNTDFKDFTLVCRALVDCRLFEQPTLQSLLNNVGVKYFLRRLAEASGFDQPLDSRRERAGYVVQRNLGIYTIEAELLQPISSCMSRPDPVQFDALQSDPDLIIRAVIHTHPQAGGPMTTVAPAECIQIMDDGEVVTTPAGTPIQVPVGPSRQDWRRWEGLTEVPYEGWMLSPDDFHRWWQIGGPLVFQTVFAKHILYHGENACIP